MCNGCLLSRNAFAPLSSLKRARSAPHKTCGTECQELKSSLFTLSTEEEVIVLARAAACMETAASAAVIHTTTATK